MHSSLLLNSPASSAWHCLFLLWQQSSRLHFIDFTYLSHPIVSLVGKPYTIADSDINKMHFKKFVIYPWISTYCFFICDIKRQTSSKEIFYLCQIQNKCNKGKGVESRVYTEIKQTYIKEISDDG